MCWEVFLLLLTALLVSTLLCGGGWRGTGSKKGVSKGRSGGGTGELAPSLFTAPCRRLLLLRAGDVEKNPGPRFYGNLLDYDVDMLVEELSPVYTKWEALGRALGVSQEHLEAIHTHPGDSLREMLRMWFPSSYDQYWSDVVDALRSIGEDSLCNELKVKYGLLEKTDLDVVAKELDGITTKWYTLGQDLLAQGYAQGHLDSIHSQYSHDSKACLREMLSKRMGSYPTTWSDIIAGLRRSGVSQLADYLQTKYCSSLLHESHLDVVVKELSTVSAKWENLGQELGMKLSVNSIRTAYSNSADCLRELIKNWMQLSTNLQGRLLTWNHVVLALKRPIIGESQLGDSLKEKYFPAAVGGAHKILEEALKKGYVNCYIWKVLVMGAAGSGKTSLKHRLFGEEPPSIRCSTALAEAAIRAISREIVGTDLTGWFRVTYDQLMEMLSGVLKAGIPMEETKVSSSDTPDAVFHGQLPKKDARNSPETPKTDVDLGTSSRASPQTPTASMHTSTTPAAKQISFSKRELVRLVEKSKGSKRFVELHWIHFIDSGGQPEFHEVLPAFIRNTTATIFVMKLSERLDEHPTIEYYDDNGQLCGKPYRYALRNDQMLQHCIRTVLSQPSTREGKHSKVFLVGTHRDLESSSSESQAEKNRKLTDILPPSLQDQLVYYRPFSEVIFPVNAKNPVELDHEVFAMIRKLVEDKRSTPPPYKVPVGWFLLEQDISKAAKRGVISRKECVAIAAVLNISGEALTAALEYFDDLNIFLYYPSVLPEVVFSSPQVLPYKVTELVHFSYSLQSESPPLAVEGKWLQFREKGIVTVDMLSDERFSAHYISDLFAPADLIKLFQHLFILAPLSKTNYFMPSLLQMMTPEEVRKQLPPPSTSAAPLLVHFPAGCAQNGVFCALVVYLMSNCHWKIAYSPKGTPHCVSRSYICFQLPDIPVCVALVDSFAYLEVHVFHTPQNLNAIICHKIREAIFSGLEEASKVLQYSVSMPRPAFFCKCGSPQNMITKIRHMIRGAKGSSPPHAAVPSSSLNGEECYLMCTKSTYTDDVPITKQQAIWLDVEAPPTTESHPFWRHVLCFAAVVGIAAILIMMVNPDLLNNLTVPHSSKMPSEPISVVASYDRPDLLKLLNLPSKSGNINIPEQIGTNYLHFGVLLLNDKTGAEVNAIVTKHREDAEQINLEILRLWIGGKGKPLSWDTLISVLKEIGLNTLAGDIEDSIQH